MNLGKVKKRYELLIMKECHKKRLYCILHRLQDVFLLYCIVETEVRAFE